MQNKLLLLLATAIFFICITANAKNSLPSFVILQKKFTISLNDSLPSDTLKDDYIHKIF